MPAAAVPTRVLFLHPDFPGQYGRLSAALSQLPGYDVLAMGDAARMAMPASGHGLRLLPYRTRGASASTHHYLRSFEAGVRRGQSVARELLRLQRSGWMPDLALVHPGWGDGLYLKDVFPEVKVLTYCEFYYRSSGSDVGFDPEHPASFDDRLRLRTRNALNLLALESCDLGIVPTDWQRRQFPAEFQSKLVTLHDGIDTRLLVPDPAAELVLPGTGRRLAAGQEVITYVARGLEPYRGFHTFMRALPAVLRQRPEAQVVVVGGDPPAYGNPPAGGGTHREQLLAELGDRLDTARVHFLGTVEPALYRRVLQISAAHVYLSYPFVLSWSMLEAMAAGCLVVGSATPPVEEVICHGDNGLLVDFFSPEALTETLVEALSTPSRYGGLRHRARTTAVDRYDWKRTLPRHLALLRQMLAGPLPDRIAIGRARA